MSFNDIFKSSFMANFTSFSLGDILLALFVSFVIGLFITQVYKYSTSNIVFSASFGVTIIGLCMITTFVILAVTSNVVLSLGMVGALSIVRFRTAIKEPLDIVYLFWAIAVGIVIGAGLIPLAFIGSILIGIMLFVFTNTKGIDTPYLIILNCSSSESEKNAILLIEKNIGKYKVKSKTISNDNIENTIEIRLKDKNTSFVNELTCIEGVRNVVLLNYNGEYIN